MPPKTKPKTSRRSVVRRKLHAQLEVHLRINGIEASSEPSTPSAIRIDADTPNLRLERAMTNLEKKRKAESKTTVTTSKKQKIATALAEPTRTTTIKNVCMCQWNKQQPGGQGLAADFGVYFKGLSDTDKNDSKKRCASPKLPREAKAAAKKPGEVPSTN